MKKLVAVFLLFSVLKSNAQLQRNYTIYNVDNGLAQNTVWDAIQDYKGFMWFGTADGVNRFDGYTMHIYQRVENDATSIGGTTSFTFFEDSKQQLWIAHDRGIDVYNRAFNNFIRIQESLDGAAIIGQNDSILWAISRKQNLHGYNIHTLRLVHKIPVNLNWHNSHGSTVSTVKIKSSFFIGDIDRKMIEFIPDELKVNYHEITNEGGFCLNQLSDSTFGRFYRKSASIVTAVNNKLSVKRVNYNSTLYYFSGGTIYDNQLYAAGANGLFVFDKNDLSFIRQETKFENKGNTAFHYIQNARTDRNNNLYLCSNGGGLYVYSPFRNKFKHYNNYNAQKSLVKAITKLPNGKILAGVYAEGLTVFNQDGSHTLVCPNVIEGEISTVSAFYPKSDKEQWLIYSNKISVFNTNTNQIKSYLVSENTSIGFGFPVIDSLNGRLVVNAALGSKSYIIDITTRKIIYSFDINNISCYKQLNDSIVLFGAVTGVYIFNIKTNKITPTSIKNSIKSILVNDRKQIYIASINGLFLVDNNINVLKHYTKSDGLVNNFLYGLLSDNNGRVWFSHNKGISVLNPGTNKFKHYGVIDGLQSNEFNTGAYYKDANGLLYFGGVNGLNVIDPENIIENKNKPQIAINEILLGDKPYKSDTAYNEITTLNFDYLNNTISFNFSALDFSQPSANTYMYILQGYDHDWIYSGTDHFARYANLPPGKYVFKIKAANGDGVWSETDRLLPVNVAPPFWKTSWFYVAMVILGTALVVAMVYVLLSRQKLRIKRELEIQQKLEGERLRISRDLHDNVGAQLSYLITNIDWMLKHPNEISEAEEQQRLKTLSDTGRNAILTLRQTIWAISNSSLSIDDFADRFKQFALKMVEFDRNIHVEFTEQVEHKFTLTPVVALNLFRICQEAFNNCLKHAACTIISIDFKTRDNKGFEISVRDNGVGFNISEIKQEQHYGLLNMRERSKEMDVELSIDSEKGSGTEVKIILK